MSRILLLFILVLWMCWTPREGSGPATDLAHQTVIFLVTYGALVVALGLWSRLAARRVANNTLYLSLMRFNRVMFIARLAVPIWFGVGVYALGWGTLVQRALGPVASWPISLPGLLLGTLPAFLAWMGLWWAQYPVDIALREQNVFNQLDSGLPLHAPPTLRRFMASNLRLQILFTVVPIFLIVAIRDIAAAVLWTFGVSASESSAIDSAVSMGSVVIVLVLAPEILRRVLHTQRLGDSPLRSRLEEMCRRNGLRYRDILLWHTENNMGNAAVMGLIPRVRYVLLSDLLLETMTDEQIEAVFAHELGHVVHRHLTWYIVFFAAVTLAAVPGQMIYDFLAAHLPLLRTGSHAFSLEAFSPETRRRITDAIGLVTPLAMLGAVVLAFGYIARRFERQADVFAARTMEAMRNNVAPSLSHVGTYGANLFASALYRVAVVNNIPIAARDWAHGSIVNRMDYLHGLSTDPARTGQFDRLMRRVYASLIGALLLLALWTALSLLHPHPTAATPDNESPVSERQIDVSFMRSPGPRPVTFQRS